MSEHQPPSQTVRIDYFSDILCIWAYIAQLKIDECRTQFGRLIELRSHFIPIFGDVPTKLETGWAKRGGQAGYADHVQSIAAQFPSVEIDPNAWRREIPATSTSAHLFITAAQLLEDQSIIDSTPNPDWSGRSAVEELAWHLRRAFFIDCRNIARRSVQHEIATSLDLPNTQIEEQIESGVAFAALHADGELQKKHLIEGSPTFLLNEGRQKLYGNVGYRVIQANIEELLTAPDDRASWC